MKKHNHYTVTPYHLIQLKYDNDNYYDKPDRIIKNSTPEQAINSARELWNTLSNPFWIKVVNEKNEVIKEYRK